MVALGYYINRELGLTISLSLILTSSAQIFIYHYLQKKKKDEVEDGKWYIHLGCLFTGITVMIGFIDAFGAFGLFSFDVQKILINTLGVRGVMSSVCFIIYGHFAVHYRAARKPIPKFFAKSIIISFILNTLGSLLGAILNELVSGALFRIEVIFQVIWITSILIIDGYGYFLVRILIVEISNYHFDDDDDDATTTPSLSTPTSQQQQHSPTRSPSPKNRGPASRDHDPGGEINTEELLVRFRRFHMGILGFNGGYLIYLIIYLCTKSEAVFLEPNPNQFSLKSSTTFVPYTILLLQGILTWWGWIPFTREGGGTPLREKKKYSRHQPQQRKIASSPSSSPIVVRSDKNRDEEGVGTTIKTETEIKSSAGLIHSPSEECGLLTPSSHNCKNFDNNSPTTTGLNFDQFRNPEDDGKLREAGPIPDVSPIETSNGDLMCEMGVIDSYIRKDVLHLAELRVTSV